MASVLNEFHKWEGIERIVVRLILSGSIVAYIFGVPFYIFAKTHDFQPFASFNQSLHLIFLFPWVLGPIIIAVVQRQYQDLAHTFAGTYGLSIMCGLLTRKAPFSNIHHITVTVVISFLTTWGHASIVHVLRFFRTFLGSKYEAVYGLIVLYFITSVCITFAIELSGHLKHARMDTWHICIFSFQFFQEFAVSALFIDTGGLSWEFAVLLAMVVAYDFFTETGLIYEKQKVFAEAFATPTLLAILLYEHTLGNRYGFSIVTRSVDDDFNFGQTMISYLILIVVEIIMGMINSRIFDNRLLRFRNLAVRKSICFKSTDLKGREESKRFSARRAVTVTTQDPHQGNLSNGNNYNKKDGASINPSAQKSSASTLRVTPDMKSAPESSRKNKPHFIAQSDTLLTVDAKTDQILSIRSEDDERSEGTLSARESKLPPAGDKEGAKVGELNLPATGRTPLSNTPRARSSFVVANSAILPRLPSFANVLPILNPLRSKVSFDEHLKRNREHRLMYVVGAVLSVCITLRFFATDATHF
eukprot:CAMPEP_0167749136 /NCGR_PEP_ID=MMETSP0110_2-20121227/5231_1 /TAXON_ID=629695 /ORGANISM="Gymnochlora sp., Strain CCMP2014" /LENGTH=529 /DNA_ID=CAMNT_0007634239 /DNA_START=189 /DNA_END=1778 /DNA_ORIENTATION=-